MASSNGSGGCGGLGALVRVGDSHELWLINAPQARRPPDQCAADCTTGSSCYCPHETRGTEKEREKKEKRPLGSSCLSCLLTLLWRPTVRTDRRGRDDDCIQAARRRQSVATSATVAISVVIMNFSLIPLSCIFESGGKRFHCCRNKLFKLAFYANFARFTQHADDDVK